MRYAGSKYDHAEQINNIIRKSDATTYIELFGGSLATFLNLDKEFDKYIINELHPELHKVYCSVRDVSYDEFDAIRIDALERFGDFGQHKESYYNLRKYVNAEKLFSTDVDRGLWLMLLISSCINSLARFGPNGFNQAFGRRNAATSITREQYDDMQQRLKSATILNVDAIEWLANNENCLQDALVFLDPPYELCAGAYNNNSVKQKTVYELARATGADIVYTDILNETVDCKDYEVLRTRRKPAKPGRANYEDVVQLEVAYYLIKQDVKMM